MNAPDSTCRTRAANGAEPPQSTSVALAPPLNRDRVGRQIVGSDFQGTDIPDLEQRLAGADGTAALAHDSQYSPRNG